MGNIKDYPLTGQMQDTFREFLQLHPGYEATSIIDELRSHDYARLDEAGHIYLDYTGGGLYADSQIRDHMALLKNNVFGNPHSLNPTSRAATALVDEARCYVLEYFNASPDEYDVIFTQNASGALKLVGESYPFASGDRFLLAFDNHNSVNGIREFARHKGATVIYLPMTAPDLRLSEDQLLAVLDKIGNGNNLFAYPAQSNFSGVQHPLEWIAEAQKRGWDVLLDGAAFAPTNRLDLSQWHPDFVPVSFYKIFGYPTGIGCLLVRKTALEKLRRPWFSGGTVWAATVQGDWHQLAESWEAFEDGTVNYLGIPAVEIGLKHIQKVGIDTIHERVMALTSWLLDNLLSLKHNNGSPLVEVYGPENCHMRGGTIALNFRDPDGSVIDERVVDLRASERHISLRTGCFCNPGAGEVAFSIPKELLVANANVEARTTFDQFLEELGLQSAGAVRVSLGFASNFADVYHFIEFAKTFLDNFPQVETLPSRSHC